VSVAPTNPIAEREARSAADLDARCVRAWHRLRSIAKAARSLGLTSARVRAAIDRAGPAAEAEAAEAGRPPRVAARPLLVDWKAPAESPEPPEPRIRERADAPDARDLEADPIDAAEVEGWLALRGAGWHDVDIAEESGVAAHLVAQLCSALKARRAREGEAPGEARAPRLNPRFVVGSFTPSSGCFHHCARCGGSGKVARPGAAPKSAERDACPDCEGFGGIRKGSRDYCPACDRSGLDGLHPALVRDPAKDPKPEPRRRETKPKPESRKQRRERRARELDAILRRTRYAVPKEWKS